MRLLSVINESRSVGGLNGKGQTFLTGSEVKYVDFLLLNAIRTMEHCYGVEKVAQCLSQESCGNLKDVVENVKGLDKVKAYLETSPPVLYESISAAKLFGNAARSRSISPPKPPLQTAASISKRYDAVAAMSESTARSEATSWMFVCENVSVKRSVWTTRHFVFRSHQSYSRFATSPSQAF